jgi:hypothetical protein
MSNGGDMILAKFRATGCWFLAVVLAGLCGCGRPALIADDAVAMAGRPVSLNAYVGHAGLFDLHNDIRHATVTFSAGQRRVGQDAVDDNGHAFVVYDDPAGPVESFVARAKVNGRKLSGQGQIFRWREDRVIVAVDVDYCIVQTNYVRLLFGKHIPVSPPFPGARDVLTALSENYQILYLTARPRAMLNRTRDWLDHYGFPPGPVIVSDHFHSVLHQLEWKRDTLKDLHVRYPNLLVSIGNRKIDIESAIPNHVLPLIVQSVENDTHDGPTNVVLQDWQAIGEFFRANREALIDPRRLDASLLAGTKLLQPVRQEAHMYRYISKCVGADQDGEPSASQANPR